MKAILIFFCSVIASTIMAQDYKESLGLRGGSTSGFTYRTLYTTDKSAEFILSGNDGGLQITGLMEKHRPFVHERIKNVYIYSGFGGHMGYRNIDFKYNYIDENFSSQRYYPRKSFVFGIDYIIGAEYYLPNFPISFGIDFKPNAEFRTPMMIHFDLWDVGLSIKYCFDSNQNSLKELLNKK